MPDKKLDSVYLGHVYAQALANTAQQQQVLPQVTDDVHALMELLDKAPHLEAFAQAVTISPEEKTRALDKMFSGKFHPLTVRTLQAMARRNRLMFIRGFGRAFDQVLEQISGRTDVEITVAATMADAALGRIRDSLGRTLNKTVQLHQKVDPALIGGAILRIGDTMIDGSIETQLQRIGLQLQSKGGDAMRQRVDALVESA